MRIQTTWLPRARSFVASRGFFRGVVALLIAQAVWIALTGRYPMAFDENFHLGIIRLYAHHLSPFWSGQPAGGDAYGAVARDPSYLYQYLMSFPYRLVYGLSHNLAATVLVLRAISIALFAYGLVLYRRLLLKAGASRGLVNACLLVFVLLPVVPLLAAQINYDNLLLPVIAALLLLTLSIKQRLRPGWPLPVLRLLVLLTGCLLASLIKYPFLPIFLAIVLYLGFSLWRNHHRRLWAAARQGWGETNSWRKWLAVVLLFVAAGLFFERYGINTLRYHTPVPDCGQVLSVQHCSAYSPWIRDYNFNLHKAAPTSPNPFVYSADWFYGMWLRTFFAVDGPATGFDTKGPLPLPAISAIVVAGLALIAFAFSLKKMLRRYDRSALGLMGLVTLVYIGALWLDEYKAFLHTGQPVAINGRYLVPVALFIMLAGALALNEVSKRLRFIRAALAVVVVLCMVWGGGALTYILRSKPAWYWQDNAAVRSANQAVQHVVGPVVPGYQQPDLFL